MGFPSSLLYSSTFEVFSIVLHHETDNNVLSLKGYSLLLGNSVVNRIILV